MRAEFAGSLRERIVIEALDGERTAAGLRVDRWSMVCSCQAAVSVDGSGAEAEAMVLSAMPRFRVTMRRRDGVMVGQRVRWRTSLLMIRQLLADPLLPERMTLRCEEVRA